jgi:hypothetical protein
MAAVASRFRLVKVDVVRWFYLSYVTSPTRILMSVIVMILIHVVASSTPTSPYPFFMVYIPRIIRFLVDMAHSTDCTY